MNLLEGGSSTGTAFVLEEKYIEHILAPNHVESPERLKAIRSRMGATRLEKRVRSIRAREQNPLPFIRLIHPDPHIELVKQGVRDESICRLAVAGALAAVDAICTGQVTNAFCALRPPGHHAADFGPYGFCFYNNVAVAARYAQKRYGLKKVLIVDWDYHHGNGTEWAFYEDPTVLYFSTHALYAFPGTGHPSRKGRGPGYGFNINVPLPRGAGDREILAAFENEMLPAAESFKPDIVMISAGFDSRHDDLLGDFTVTDDGFRKLTELMMDVARRHCQSRLLSVLEGGYNTQGLALAVEAHVKSLLGRPKKLF